MSSSRWLPPPQRNVLQGHARGARRLQRLGQPHDLRDRQGEAEDDENLQEQRRFAPEPRTGSGAKRERGKRRISPPVMTRSLRTSQAWAAKGPSCGRSTPILISFAMPLPASQSCAAIAWIMQALGQGSRLARRATTKPIRSARSSSACSALSAPAAAALRAGNSRAASLLNAIRVRTSLMKAWTVRLSTQPASRRRSALPD